jgi:hypothetical protein
VILGLAGLAIIGFSVFLILQAPPTVPILTGTYRADDGGIYYVQRSSNTLWWAGMSLDSELPADLQWHRGLNFTNVFRGTINNDHTVTGAWSDVTRGASFNTGTQAMRLNLRR